MKIRFFNTVRCVALCLALCVLFCACSFPSPSQSTTTLPNQQEYLAALTEGAGAKTENADCQSVADWLLYWGAIFDDVKFEFVESLYHNYSIYDLNAPLAVAQACVSLYCESLADAAPLSDKRLQTDLWLYCYTASVGDPYANYMNQEDYVAYNADQAGHYAGIGVSVMESTDPAGIVIATVFEGSPAQQAGLQVGDVIVAVDGTYVSEIGYEAAVAMVRGEVGSTVTLTVCRDGDVFEATAERADIEQPAVKFHMIEQGQAKIGYIYISTFASEVVAQQFKEAVDTLEQEGAQALLFDVRHNTGGLVSAVIEMLDYLLPDGKPLMRNGYYDGVVEVKEGKDGHSVNLPFAVLCSDYSASASELFISALMDYDAKGDCEAFSVGIQTYGKGCMQSLLEMTDNTALLVTVAYYDPPYSENYDGVGITPDYVIELPQGYQYVAVSNIPQEEDTQMQKALAVLVGE